MAPNKKWPLDSVVNNVSISLKDVKAWPSARQIGEPKPVGGTGGPTAAEPAAASPGKTGLLAERGLCVVWGDPAMGKLQSVAAQGPERRGLAWHDVGAISS